MSPNADDNVDTGWIANYLGVTRDHVTDRLTTEPKFPKPVIELSQKIRRWDKDAVLNYLSSRRRRGRSS